MKQSDVAVLILVISISLVMSYFIGTNFISSDEAKTAEIEIVAPISGEFSIPSDTVFNKQSVNPTENIKIGETNQQQPFTSGEGN